MQLPSLAIVIAFASPVAARADHAHGGMTHTHESTVSASLGLIAASYRNMSFVGDYQGLVPSVRWANMRFAASASLPVYRLTKNGARYYGLADAVAHGQVTLIGAHEQSAGLALAVSAPTGSARDGLGMGHVMIMPAAWGSVPVGAAVLAGSFGYGRAIAPDEDGAHQHGGPIVDPMNTSELTWSATADVALAPALRAGLKLTGAFALGDGTDRVTGGVRVMWSAGRVDTTAELQGGFAGEPFKVRGVVETALRF